MPIITKISTQKRKGRYNIFIDNEYAFSVSERTLAEKRLLKGIEQRELFLKVRVRKCLTEYGCII